MSGKASETVRFGVLGGGKIARTRFFPSIASMRDSAELIAVGTRRSQALAPADLGLADGVRLLPYDEIVNRGRDLVDAVYIALPNDLHVPWILRCLKAGLHVLCEKPLTASRAEAMRCRRESERRGVLLAEACMARHDVRYARVRELIDDGRLGQVHLLEASFSFFLEDLANIRLRRERQGGALLDVGCYGIDIARFVFGAEPVEMTARCLRGSSSEVDEVVAATLLFEGGRMATVTASTHLARYHSCRIRGSHGMVTVPDAFIPDVNKPTRIVVEFAGGERHEEESPPASPYRDQIVHFIHAVRAGDRKRLPPSEDGVANAGILEAALRSMDRDDPAQLAWSGS